MSDSDVTMSPADALAIIQRTTDPNWFAGMQASPDGQAILNAAVAIAVATSEALDEQVSAQTISDAPGGAGGTCSLMVARSSVGVTILIPHNYQFVTSSGVELVPACDVPVAADQEVIVIPLVTLRQIDLVNTVENAFDDLLLGSTSIAAIVSPDDPVLYDSGGGVVMRPGYSSLAYVSSSPITGATMDWLSVLLEERGCVRQNGETVEAYRSRGRQTPDSISPIAVQEAAMGAQTQVTLPSVYACETVNDQADADSRAAIHLVFADSPCDSDYLDDPYGVDIVAKRPFRASELVSIREGRAYFRESIDGDILEPDGFILYCDAGFCDDTSWGYMDAGLAQAIVSSILAIAAELDAKIAACVQYDLTLENAQIVSGPPGPATVLASSFANVWSIYSDPTALPGHESMAWLIRDALLSSSGQYSDGAPANSAQYLTFAFSDGTTFTTPAWSSGDSQHLTIGYLMEIVFPFGKPIVRVDAYLLNSGAFDVNAYVCGTFWFSPFALPL